MPSNWKEDIVKDAIQVSPAVGTTGGLYFYGISTADLVGLASLLLICIQALYRLWKWRQEYKENESKSKGSKSINSSDNSSS